MSEEWIYNRCKVMRVVDGDTVDLIVDLGFGLSTERRFRLFGIDAPEKKGNTLQHGKDSQEALTRYLSVYESWKIKTYKDGTDKYGRFLCVILDPDGTTINQKMIVNGHAIERYW